MVTNSAGGVLERYSYDAFGKTRNLNGSDIAAGTSMRSPSMRRGFTGHEMLSELNGGLIHMNGRIYDPNLGRFMTADPTVQFEGYSQSYNRYSYVLNNPLSFTDPTGFGLGEFAAAFEDSVKDPFTIEKSYYAFSKFPGAQDVSKFMMQNSWARALGHQAASSIPYAGWAVNAYLSGYDVWYQGGTHADIERAWAVSIGSAVASKLADKYINADSSPFFNALAHGAIGCAAADAGGGDCGRGATQSFALTLAKNYLPKAIAYLQSQTAGDAMTNGTTNSVDESESRSDTMRDVEPNAEITAQAGDKVAAVIYLRTGPNGECYVGSCLDARFPARQVEHDRKTGRVNRYKPLEQVPDSLRDMAEETLIRKYGGPAKQGGALENRRYQMNNDRYNNAGGTTPKPTGGAGGNLPTPTGAPSGWFPGAPPRRQPF